MNINDIRAMSASELTKKLKEDKKELLHLRFQHSINQLDNPMKLVEIRKEIARILTVLRERELKENA
ncbi:MAG: 50S ribosomal protein L29 [Clostridiales bacterium]|nr:50S ribosomal protein L29 [Clostridiales bacterium]